MVPYVCALVTVSAKAQDTLQYTHTHKTTVDGPEKKLRR